MRFKRTYIAEHWLSIKKTQLLLTHTKHLKKHWMKSQALSLLIGMEQKKLKQRSRKKQKRPFAVFLSMLKKKMESAFILESRQRVGYFSQEHISSIRGAEVYLKKTHKNRSLIRLYKTLIFNIDLIKSLKFIFFIQKHLVIS